MNIQGCVHVHLDQNGEIVNIFVHLTNLPAQKGVLHFTMDGGEFLTTDQFLSTHPRDREELNVPPGCQVFVLGDESVAAPPETQDDAATP